MYTRIHEHFFIIVITVYIAVDHWNFQPVPKQNLFKGFKTYEGQDARTNPSCLCPGEENLYYGDLPTRPVSTSLQSHPELSRSVPGIPAAAAAAAASGPGPQAAGRQGQGRAWALR